MTLFDNIPAKLRETGLFYCWKYEERNGKRTKIPINPRTGGNAIKYFTALRMETYRFETVKRAADIVGQKVAVDVRKCKYAPPGKRAILTLTYGKGLRKEVV